MIFVLIAEDDEDDQALIRDAFEQVVPGVQLRVADNGESLLQQLRAMPVLPALIILDVNMPRLDGFETLAELQQSERYRRIPTLMLSTASYGPYISKAYVAGAKAYLIKPNGFADLQEMVRGMQLFWLRLHDLVKHE
ncbi:Response regulator rcp1 [Fibrisoma limi BUZ 3]|uniref:Response regulator rcp1 n=1 Tax=Fibrisoma limi BUZ 3 TaxID=1185876 RepID=I2GRM7_9BACT|nr:response regulator [Fibrisoma limi]CCH56555.1 Response regulator rcp1 [Fibrisoma limi BUZ 3]